MIWLFQGEFGAVLAGSVIRRARRGARKAVLPPHVHDSPTGRRVYDNRKTRLTKRLEEGIPPARVGDCGGRLEAAGDLPEQPSAG
ncbi:hypothetical protein [Streptomyces sp. MMG1121]|uniref:hypothetical protein n=1 Tax=Streptomyces sp. MMG1121 TaxID=1415544 RepID=UPI0006AEF649|nr:hypothetical protein [Streptomyces sp. MMG1121]